MKLKIEIFNPHFLYLYNKTKSKMMMNTPQRKDVPHMIESRQYHTHQFLEEKNTKGVPNTLTHNVFNQQKLTQEEITDNLPSIIMV